MTVANDQAALDLRRAENLANVARAAHNISTKLSKQLDDDKRDVRELKWALEKAERALAATVHDILEAQRTIEENQT